MYLNRYKQLSTSLSVSLTLSHSLSLCLSVQYVSESHSIREMLKRLNMINITVDSMESSSDCHFPSLILVPMIRPVTSNETAPHKLHLPVAAASSMTQFRSPLFIIY